MAYTMKCTKHELRVAKPYYPVEANWKDVVPLLEIFLGLTINFLAPFAVYQFTATKLGYHDLNIKNKES